MTSAEPVERKQLRSAAVIGGNDADTRGIVEDVLEGIQVPCFVEGSVVYAVLVYERDLARARQALQAEPRLADRWIKYGEEAQR